LREGQPVIAIGSALGTLLNTVTRGVVSGLRSSGGATLIQNDAAINPGNSGGPLLDRQGRAIGVTTMTDTDKPSISFAVAIDHVSDLMAGRLQDGGTAQRGLLDVQAASRPAESDRRKKQGEQELRAGLEHLVTNGRDIDASWKEFRDECFTSPIAGRYNREWFAVLVPRAVPTDAAAGCVSFYNALESNIKQFQGLMRRLLAEARRADLLPGTIRDKLRENRLEFDWDR
jgi:Trypsin-like peptidase domain